MYNNKKLTSQKRKNEHFLRLRNSCAFLLLDYDQAVLRSFNSNSIDVRAKPVLSAIGQIEIDCEFKPLCFEKASF